MSEPALKYVGGYGLWDSLDGCWLGNQEGPLLYRDWHLAQAAAVILDHQMGWPYGRTQARVYDGSGNTLRDTLAKQMDAVQAMLELDQIATAQLRAAAEPKPAAEPQQEEP